MKKVFIVILAFMLLSTALFVVDCCLRNDPVSCPGEAMVVSVSVADRYGAEKAIDEYYYASIIAGIRNSVPTIKDSVNDTPDAEDYYTVNVNTENEQYRYFVYQKGSQWYLEKPYEGIYKLHEIVPLVLSKECEAE